MRIGLSLPQYGRFADPALTVRVAAAAEEIGYDSLWVGDRLLVATEPQTPYRGGRDVLAHHETFLDPLTLLTVAAGVTRRARLGTNTLNALWQPPVLLARTLATIDQVSAGRLDVGLGLGWSRDEYQAVGTPWPGRGARLEETLDLFDRIWAEDEVVRHDGALWTVPSSYIRLKPRQRPRPPVLLGGSSPATLARVGRRADGWLAFAVPLPLLAQDWGTVTEHAAKAGREGAALRLVLRVNPVFSADPVPEEQVPGRGTVRQLADYLSAAVESLGAEPMIDLHHAAGDLEEYLDLARELHDLVRSRTA